MTRKFEDLNLFLLFQSSKLIKDKLLEKFKESNINISVEQFLLLQLIKDEDGIKQQELADSLGKDKTTMVRLIDSMEKKGLVKRVKPKEDIRKKLIYIEKNGKEQLPKAEKVITDFSKEISTKIGSKNNTQLKSLLKALLSLEEQTSLF